MTKNTSVLLALSLLLAGALALAGCGMFMGYEEPAWTSVATHADGTQYVSDGRMALEIGLAGVDAPPSATSNVGWFAEGMRRQSVAENPIMFALQTIKDIPGEPEHLALPAGNLKVESKYITYIANKYAPSHSVGFFNGASIDPLIVVFEGKAVGAIKFVGQE